MKQMMKLFQILIPALLLWGCEKDENRIYFEGATPPVLTSTISGEVPLLFKDADKEVLKVSWTNPEYQFTTGVSSQDVSYLLEIDTTGSNFTNPKRRTLSIKNNLSKSFTHSELNDYLLNTLELQPDMPHAIEMRVTASLNGAAVPVSSNVLQLSVTPYSIPPKVAPPASGKLFIVGNATPGGWDNPVPVPAQEFTQVSPTIYEITVPLTGGNSYLFLPVNGDWSAKYGAMGDNNSNNVNGDDFKAGGGDLKAPDASGDYKIQVNFQTGRFTLTKL
jgi:hypothetical protein